MLLDDKVKVSQPSTFVSSIKAVIDLDLASSVRMIRVFFFQSCEVDVWQTTCQKYDLTVQNVRVMDR